MCMSSNNKAADEANRAEAERQAAISSTQAAVNNVFDGQQRAADIADLVNATRDFYTGDLNRQKAETDRQIKFALARGGLTGGSTQIDQNRKMADTYSRGLLDVERRAQGAGAGLESADQDARARLIQLATSGLDMTTGAQQAAAALRSNLEAAKGDQRMGAFGDAFSNFKAFLDQSRDAAERRRANRDTGFNPYGGQYGGGYGY